MSDEGRSPSERVKLNLRVSKSVKDAFEDVIRGKRGSVSPYAAVVLENELRVLLDEGMLSKLWATTRELADAHDLMGPEEKIRSRGTDRGETTVVGYQIAADVRSNLIELAEQQSGCTAGKIVEDVMWRYATDGSTIERVIGRLEQIEQATTSSDEDTTSSTPSVKQRRTRSIADALTPGDFTIEDFDDAVDVAASGISSGSHAREEYLPRVLEYLDYTWHPLNSRIFRPREDINPPNLRDPRTKPSVLMDDNDKSRAIACEAYEEGQKAQSPATLFDVTDATNLLETTPQKAREMMKQLNPRSGYSYREDKGALSVHPRRVRERDGNNDILSIVHRDSRE